MDWYLEPWRKFGDFNGRARRREYWIFNLVNLLIVAVLAAVFIPALQHSSLSTLVYVPIGLFVVAAVIPSLAVSVRRLHDTGRSGWWWWISLIPYVGRLIFFVLTVLDGTPGANEYGQSPKEQPFDAYEVAEIFS